MVRNLRAEPGHLQPTSIDLSRFYDILGVSPQASDAEVRTAYRRRALATHPDKHGGDAVTFRLVVEAFERVSNSARDNASRHAAVYRRAHVRSVNIPPQCPSTFAQTPSTKLSASSESKKRKHTSDQMHQTQTPSGRVRESNKVPQQTCPEGSTQECPDVAKTRPESLLGDFLQNPETSWKQKIFSLTARELETIINASRDFDTKSRKSSSHAQRRDDIVIPGTGADYDGSGSSSSDETLLALGDDIGGSSHEQGWHCDSEASIMEAPVPCNVDFGVREIGYPLHDSERRNHVTPTFKLQRGIHQTQTATYTAFRVSSSCQNFTVVTQCTHSLEKAIEWHIASVRIRTMTLSALKDGIPFDRAIEDSLESVLRELDGTEDGESTHGRFRNVIRFSFKLMHSGVRVDTPFVRDLRAALCNRNKFLELKADGAPREAFIKAKADMLAQKRIVTGGRVRDHGGRNRDGLPRRLVDPEVRANRRLCKLLTAEAQRRRSILRSQRGVPHRKLPVLIDSILDEVDSAMFFANLPSHDPLGLPIRGPLQTNLARAVVDAEHLLNIQVNAGGDEEAQAEADRMDIEAAVSRFAAFV